MQRQSYCTDNCTQKHTHLSRLNKAKPLLDVYIARSVPPFEKLKIGPQSVQNINKIRGTNIRQSSMMAGLQVGIFLIWISNEQALLKNGVRFS